MAELAHVAVAVTFCVEPSLYVAVAVNCWVAPALTVGLAGVIAIEEIVGATAVTLSALLPLTLLSEAVMVADPAATAVTIPLEFTVATDAALLVQLTELVTLAVDPSL